MGNLPDSRPCHPRRFSGGIADGPAAAGTRAIKSKQTLRCWRTNDLDWVIIRPSFAQVSPRLLNRHCVKIIVCRVDLHIVGCCEWRFEREHAACTTCMSIPEMYWHPSQLHHEINQLGGRFVHEKSFVNEQRPLSVPPQVKLQTYLIKSGCYGNAYRPSLGMRSSARVGWRFKRAPLKAGRRHRRTVLRWEKHQQNTWKLSLVASRTQWKNK